MKYFSHLIFTGSERTIIIKKNILGSFAIKGLGMLTTFILVPLTINLINIEKYGIWITIFSIISWFSMMDIGLGNGFRNKFAEAIALNKKELAREYVHTLYSSMILIAGVLLLLYVMLNPFLNWHKILNTPTYFDENINIIIGTVFVLFCIQLVLKNVSTILLSLQKTTFSNSLIFLGNLLAFVLIYLFDKFYYINLLAIAIIFMISPIIIFSITTGVVFKKYLGYSMPKLFSLPKKKYFIDLMGLGIKFFIIQITSIVVVSSSSIIITQLYGPAEVTPYNVTFQLFATAQFFFSIIVTPFWSAFTDANAKKEYEWIKRSINKLILLWVIFAFGILILWLISPMVFRIWLGGEIIISYDFALQFAIFSIIMTWISIFSFFVNGVGKIKLALYVSIFQLIITIPLAIFLAEGLNLKTTGIIMATNIIMLIPAILLAIQTRKIITNKAHGIWNK